MVDCSPNGIQTCANNIIWECQDGQWVPVASGQCAGFQAQYKLRPDFFNLIFNDFGARTVLINELIIKIHEAFPAGNVDIATFPSILEFDANHNILKINFWTMGGTGSLGNPASGGDLDLIAMAGVGAGILILIATIIFAIATTISGVGIIIGFVIGGGLIIAGTVKDILSGEQAVQITKTETITEILNSDLSPEDKAAAINQILNNAISADFIGDLTNLVLVSGAVVGGVIVGRELIKSGLLKKT